MTTSRFLPAAVAVLGLTVGPARPASAQTDKPCDILFENLSREHFTLRDVSVLQADGTRKAIGGAWGFAPGERAYLAGDDNKRIEGRQVFYAVELPDGTRSRQQSTATRPLALDRDCILQWWDDNDFGELRKKDKGRTLSKAQATYRYWNAVHGLYLEEVFDAIQSIGFLEFSKVTATLRTIAQRIDDLDTSGVDGDAVAAGKAYAGVLREIVKVASGRGGARLAAMVGELYNLRVDSFTKMLDENQMIAGKTEDVFQFMRSRRKALEKRYDLRFPHLVPPVSVGLAEFTFSKGYYVNLLNTSGEDLKGVQIRYRDADGRVKHQSVTNRLVFDSAAGLFDSTQVDPADVKWRVDPGEWVTVTYEGGAYSYPTSKLIKK